MKLKSIVTRLSIPPGVVSRYYFIPNNDPIISLHKKSLFFVPSKGSKTLYALLAIMQQLLWWFYFGWMAFFKVWNIKSKFLLEINHQKLSNFKIFFDLFQLTFFNTIPPIYYFWFRLYSLPKSKWLYFIYNHETSKWQHVLSKKISEESSLFISSKHFFWYKGMKNGVSIVPISRFIPKKNSLIKSELFLRDSFFIKPDSGSGSKGCFSLIFDSVLESYTLRSELNSQNIITDKDAIVKILNGNFYTRDYLIQPLLRNHNDISDLSKSEKIITTRVITVFKKGNVKLLSAILEVPTSSDKYKFFRVNTENGQVCKNLINQYFKRKTPTEQEFLLNKCRNIYLPMWKEVVREVIKAHSLCTDIYTIGWDIIITNKKVYLVEGNFGYGARIHQMDWIDENEFVKNII